MPNTLLGTGNISEHNKVSLFADTVENSMEVSQNTKGEFPGSPVVRTRSGFSAWLGN